MVRFPSWTPNFGGRHSTASRQTCARRFICGERKSVWGKLAIGKPVGLQVVFAFDLSKGIIAIEVANVKTTRLVGETCRLLYDYGRAASKPGVLHALGASCFSPVARLNESYFFISVFGERSEYIVCLLNVAQQITFLQIRFRF